VSVVIPYSPRWAFEPFHDRAKRWACLVCHRRDGKTVACVNELIKAACNTDKENARFAYVAPQYSQAKDIAWGYVKQFTGAIPGIAYNESELRCDFPNGARVRLYGTENESRLRGLYLDGVILDEYADIHPRVFDEIIRPLLADRKGWAVFIGTPCGHNDFYRTYQKALRQPEEWYSLMLKGSESGILDPDEMEAMKREMSEDAYQQEVECSFEAAIKGAIYGKEMKNAEDEGRITAVPYNSSSEVWTGWDLGVGDATAIWFVQQVGREPHIIDYYASRGAGLDHYVKVLKDKPYNYAKHLLPHDADKTELGSGMSVIEQLKAMGIRNTRVVPKLSIAERIEVGRKLVRMAWFDQVKALEGIEALKQWRYEYDALTGVSSKKPVHNWASHAGDSFTYLAVGFKPDSMEAPPLAYPNLAIP